MLNTNWTKAEKVLKDMEMSLRGYLENTPAAHIPAIQVHLMAALYDKDGQHASELARAVGKPATSFTPILDGLQDAGYVLRRPDPKDRRAIYVYLTANGEALKPHITAALERLDSDYTVLVKKTDGKPAEVAEPV